MPDQDSVFSGQEQSTKTEQQEQQTQVEQTPQGEQQPQGQQQSNAQSDNVFADQLASIKNESGEPKYKDLPTALDALKHSQEYIPTLRSENETLKQEVERLKGNEERMKQLEDSIDRLATPPQEEPEAQPSQQGLTEEQLQDLLDKKLQERDSQAQAAQNLKGVDEALRNQFGEKVSDVVAQKAHEYGMTPKELGDWAVRSPKAVLALFEIKSSPQGGKPNPSSSVNIPPVAPNQHQELAPPERSLLSGASNKEKADYYSKVREDVYRRLGVQE